MLVVTVPCLPIAADDGCVMASDTFSPMVQDCSSECETLASCIGGVDLQNRVTANAVLQFVDSVILPIVCKSLDVYQQVWTCSLYRTLPCCVLLQTIFVGNPVVCIELLPLEVRTEKLLQSGIALDGYRKKTLSVPCIRPAAAGHRFCAQLDIRVQYCR